MSTSSRRSAPVLPVSYAFTAVAPPEITPFTSSPPSPSPFAYANSYYSSSPPLCGSSTGFYSDSSQSPGFFSQRRSVSPSRVNLHGLSPPAPSRSVRFSIDRSVSPRRSIAAPPPRRNPVLGRRDGNNIQKRTCLCSPTNHPGSFRCALHKNSAFGGGGGGNHTTPYSPNRLNMRRSAMTNSLVRIGTVEGDLVKRALAALIRPSSHQQRRRAGFEPRPSRLSVMSKAEDLR